MTKNPPKKKRQHYVPKMLLRKFSGDDKTISLLVLSDGKQISGAGLKEQCYENYFYGADGKLENAFADFEGKFSTIIGDLSPAHLEKMSPEQVFDARLFVHYQRARTVGAAEELNDFNDILAKQILSKDSQFSDMDLEKFRITITHAQHESLYHATAVTPLLMDLEVKFLVSDEDRKLGFVTSDHPVILYNQFAEYHPKFRHYTGTTGLAVKGLQMFLPLSPRVCVAAYDPTTYEMGSPKKRTCGIGMRDIRLLNTLQVLHAYECLYFDPTYTPSEELERLKRDRTRHNGWRQPRMIESEMEHHPDNTSSQIVWSSKPEVRVGAQFNFMKIIDRATYDDYDLAIVPIRSQKLFEATRQYGEYLDKMKEENRAKKKDEGA